MRYVVPEAERCQASVLSALHRPGAPESRCLLRARVEHGGLRVCWRHAGAVGGRRVGSPCRLGEAGPWRFCPWCGRAAHDASGRLIAVPVEERR